MRAEGVRVVVGGEPWNWGQWLGACSYPFWAAGLCVLSQGFVGGPWLSM